MELAALTRHDLRGDYAQAGDGLLVDQHWSDYSAAEHALWRRLHARQSALADRHGCAAFRRALARIDVADGVPDLQRVSIDLAATTGWRLVGVPGLIPADLFFGHLAARRFPVTTWLRRPEEADYLVEPDIFHDFFGHVPMLFDPDFAAFVAAYGRIATAARTADEIDRLTRLYWFTVEFGLIAEADGLKAFGAGLLSSAGELVHATTASTPTRRPFDAARAMATGYRIDAFQPIYFVLDDFAGLRDAVQRLPVR